jgi:hypothetical protein
MLCIVYGSAVAACHPDVTPIPDETSPDTALDTVLVPVVAN